MEHEGHVRHRQGTQPHIAHEKNEQTKVPNVVAACNCGPTSPRAINMSAIPYCVCACLLWAVGQRASDQPLARVDTKGQLLTVEEARAHGLLDDHVLLRRGGRGEGGGRAVSNNTRNWRGSHLRRCSALRMETGRRPNAERSSINMQRAIVFTCLRKIIPSARFAEPKDAMVMFFAFSDR